MLNPKINGDFLFLQRAGFALINYIIEIIRKTY
jgi:hypothetical protein